MAIGMLPLPGTSMGADIDMAIGMLPLPGTSMGADIDMAIGMDTDMMPGPATSPPTCAFTPPETDTPACMC